MSDEPNWRDSLSEELKEHKGLADVKDVSGLAQQFLDGQQMIGNSIRVPGEDAGEDAWKAFHAKLTTKVPGLIPTPDRDNPEHMAALYNTLGRPEDATKYTHPEGVDATKMGNFAAKAHELGLSANQYTGLLGEMQVFNQDKIDSDAAAHVEATRALKQEWGIVYEDNLQLVDAIMKGTGAPKEMLELAANGQLPPEASKWLYEIGKQLGSEGINFTKDEHTSRVSPAEAKARSAEIMGDRKGPYWDASHPQHKEYVQRVVDLNRAAAAGNI